MRIVSFFICTRGKSTFLLKTLKSIKKLKTDYLIDVNVIFNSNLKLSFEESFKKLITKKFKINFVRENKKGIPSVRNKSLKLIKKKKNIWCVGLIDDDCFIHRDWLNEMIKVYNITKADIITGPQIPINKNVYEHILQRKESHLSKIKWAATNNVFFNSKIIKKIDINFSNSLNEIGGSDQLFFLQLFKKGFKIIWNDKAKVFEKRNISGSNLDWFIKRNLRFGISTKIIYTKSYGLFTGLFMTFFKIFYEVLISIFYLLISFYKPKINFLKSIMHLARFCGIIIGLLGFRLNKYI